VTMDGNVFRTRIAPLLSPEDLRALRRASSFWQLVVDQLVPVKGAFGLRRSWKMTSGDVRFGLANMKTDACDVLAACAAEGPEDLRWALGVFKLPSLPARWCHHVVRRVTQVACLELLVWDFGVSPADAFRGCYAGGRLDLAQWIASTFTFTADDIRASNNLALRSACSHGHLAIAQWLHTTFRLTADDARADKNFALRYSCAHGHLAVAQWLVHTFHLTRKDARAEDNFALRWSCSNGHLGVAQWLTTTFHLERRDARAWRSVAFRMSCSNGHLAVAQWMATTFGLTTEDARENDDEALRSSCGNGHVHVAEWLLGAFGFARIRV
jgi:hypothetical protein